MRRPAEEGTETDALADEAGTRAMVDLMLGTTALLLVVLLAVGAQAMLHTSSRNADKAPTTAQIDALFSDVDGPVIFAEAEGIRLAGTDRVVRVGDIAGNIRLADIAGKGMPTLVIAPRGIEAAFHLTARLAALGVAAVRRVRLNSNCVAIEKVEITQTASSISCRRR